MNASNKFGKWTKGSRVGRGGQGEVFEATAEGISQPMVMKIIKLKNEKKTKRFVKEVEIHRTLSNLNTTNVVGLIDDNLDEVAEGKTTTAYLVMPRAYRALDDAREILAGRLELALEVFRGIVSGVSVLHKAGVVHRDIKPPNILFADETLRTPLVSDLGVCFAKETPDEDRITEVHETVGARFYMAPEQERGGVVDVTPAADVYALGKVLYFMLTGKRLHRERLEEAFSDDEYDAEPRLRAVHDKILSKTIVEEASARFSNGSELLVAVDELIEKIKRGDGTDAPKSHSSSGLNSGIKKLLATARGIFAKGSESEVAMLFEDAREEFEASWLDVATRYGDKPLEPITAFMEMVRLCPIGVTLTVGLAQTGSQAEFRRFGSWLGRICSASDNLSGHVSINGIPAALSGFQYMLLSIVALHEERWSILKCALEYKFELYYSSGRALFQRGFDNSYFFHSEVFNRSASRAHDTFRSLMDEDSFMQITGLEGEVLLNAYCQAQMVMCLEAARLAAEGEDVSIWPDFGRYDASRVYPMLDRAYHVREYGEQLALTLGQDWTSLMGKLNGWLDWVRGQFRSNGQYWWNSVRVWEPR